MNLAIEMAKLPEPPNDKQPPYWDAWRHQLWEMAQRHDPRSFMRWPPIYHTMLQDHWRDAIAAEDRQMAGTNNALALAEAKQDANQQSSWYNLTHQLYHLYRWQHVTGLRIQEMQTIYEFGGGYGAMALVCRRLGFAGDYYICDLPEFALLQQWYLEQHQVNNVHWVNNDTAHMIDLFIACYSLSETDFAERNRILMAWPAQSYLFLYSNKFEEYDNIAYFQRDGLTTRMQHERIKHLPPESWYTWGW